MPCSDGRESSACVSSIGTRRMRWKLPERNATAQLRLIEDVLDVSRIITGKMTLAKEPA